MNNKEFNSSQHLTYEELVAYHQGYLGNTEMHRLETHLIDCPLRNEALEGLDAIDGSELEKRISRIRQATNTIPQETPNLKQWLAVAASVLVVMVISFVFLNRSPKEELIAEQIPAENELPLEKQQPATVIVDSVASTDDSLQQATEAIPAAVPLPEERVASQLPATATPTDSNLGLTADLDPDTTVVEADMALMAATEARPTADSLNEIPDEMIADEVITEATPPVTEPAAVTTGVPRARATEGQAAKTKKATTGNIVAPKPLKGRRGYNRYLKRNLNYPAAAKENNIEGEVVLQLTVTADGTIADIKVMQSLGYGCDEEAIRLVKEGPQWQPATLANEPVPAIATVIVAFKL